MRLLVTAFVVALMSAPLCADESGSVFTCDFSDDTWYEEWGLESAPGRTESIGEDDPLRFEPHQGNALKIRVDADGHYGLSLTFRFKEMWGYEPESLYFSYYLRFADDWDPQRGGKLPGIAGTYGRAGWGGRPVNGSDGWSARGLFKGMVNGRTPIGYYCYHVDMKGQYGDSWVWNNEDRGFLQNNHWYHIVQYIQLNTPKKNDGILNAWVDGQLAFEKKDIRMRDSDALKVETVWINLYHGGKWTSETEDHIYIDDVMIAEQKANLMLELE